MLGTAHSVLYTRIRLVFYSVLIGYWGCVSDLYKARLCGGLVESRLDVGKELPWLMLDTAGL